MGCPSLTKTIEFDKPRNLEEFIRKTKYCYDQNKGKLDYHKTWKDKRNEKFQPKEERF